MALVILWMRSVILNTVMLNLIQHLSLRQGLRVKPGMTQGARDAGKERHAELDSASPTQGIAGQARNDGESPQ